MATIKTFLSSLSKSDRSSVLIFLLILGTALLVRFYNFPAWFGFDYDQEINAFLAKRILVDHKITLLGPETSTGGMFVGSYYNYFIALFYLLGRMDPMSTIILNVLISTLTLLLLYLVVKKLASGTAAIISGLIYGFSSMITGYDRVSWNPAPMPLVSLALVFCLYTYLSSDKRKYLIATLLLLGFMFHLHFTVLFMTAYVFLVLFIYRTRSLVRLHSLVLISFCLGIFLFPLVIFDLRNGFLNSRHLLQFFLATGTASNSFQISSLLQSFGRVAYLFIAFSKAIFFDKSSFFLDLLFGLFWGGFFLYVLKNWKRKENLFWNLVFLVFLILLLAMPFHRGSLPPYYFFLVFPLWVITTSVFLASIYQSSALGKLVVLTVLMAFLWVNVPVTLASHNTLALQSKQQAVSFVVKDAGSSNLDIDYIAQLGKKTGFDYLFWLAGNKIKINQGPTKHKYKIVVPYFLVKPEELTTRFGDVGVIKI